MPTHGKRPATAPFRLITERGKTKARDDFYMVQLECGHRAAIRRGTFPKKTRCGDCFRDELQSWTVENTCPHGHVGDGCKDCKIEELTARIAELEQLLKDEETAYERSFNGNDKNPARCDKNS